MNKLIRKDFGYELSFGIVFFFFNIFWTSTLFYFLGWRVSVLNILFSFLLTVCYWLWVDKYKIIFYILSLVGILFFSAFISNNFYDFSGDGQSYQQAGVIQIALGWNPIKETIIPDVWDSTHAVWMNHFPRFSWIVHGVIYKVLGSLEMSKILNIPLMISSFLVGYFYLMNIFKRKWKAVLISLLVSLNPICIGQINTYGVDTLISSLFAMLMWNIFIFFDKKFIFVRSSLFLFLLSIILFNIKWSTLGYVFVIFILILVYIVIFRKELLKKWFKIFVFAGILGVFVLGFNPYVTNTLKYGNPFYPMYSSTSVDFNNKISSRFKIPDNIWSFMVRANSPSDFNDKSWWWKFWRSIFSVSGNQHWLSYDSRQNDDTVSRLKLPFLIENGELSAFSASDVRLSGFGVWFSGAFIVSFLILLFMFFSHSRNFSKLLFYWIIILISTWINPESWWARYVPFLWFLPVLTIYLSIKNNKKYLRIGAKILGLILVANILMIIGVVVPQQWKMTQRRKAEINEMKFINNSQGIPVKIDFIANGASRMQYFESGVVFVEKRIEEGIMNNYFLNNLDKDDSEILKRNYVYDGVRLEYVLLDSISNDELLRLANIFKETKKVPLAKEGILFFLNKNLSNSS